MRGAHTHTTQQVLLFTAQRGCLLWCLKSQYCCSACRDAARRRRTKTKGVEAFFVVRACMVRGTWLFCRMTGRREPSFTTSPRRGGRSLTVLHEAVDTSRGGSVRCACACACACVSLRLGLTLTHTQTHTHGVASCTTVKALFDFCPTNERHES